jgi:hypothetical protein
MRNLLEVSTHLPLSLKNKTLKRLDAIRPATSLDVETPAMRRHVYRNLAAKEARHNGHGQKAIFCGDEEPWTERRKTGIVVCLLLVRPRLFPDSRRT